MCLPICPHSNLLALALCQTDVRESYSGLGKCISDSFVDPLCYFHAKPLCSPNKTLRDHIARTTNVEPWELQIFALGPFSHHAPSFIEDNQSGRTDVLMWSPLLCFEASDNSVMRVKVLIAAGVWRKEWGCCATHCHKCDWHLYTRITTPVCVCVFKCLYYWSHFVTKTCLGRWCGLCVGCLYQIYQSHFVSFLWYALPFHSFIVLSPNISRPTKGLWLNLPFAQMRIHERNTIDDNQCFHE